tara:strand:- start:1466 stop:1717 length:252 start_codon:yes stop_codon:yes gene_type:complete
VVYVARKVRNGERNKNDQSNLPSENSDSTVIEELPNLVETSQVPKANATIIQEAEEITTLPETEMISFVRTDDTEIITDGVKV